MSKTFRTVLLSIISVLIFALALSGILLLTYDFGSHNKGQQGSTSGSGGGSGTVTPDTPTSEYTDEKRQTFSNTLLEMLQYDESQPPTDQLEKIRYDVNRQVVTNVPNAIESAGISADVFDKMITWLQDFKKYLNGQSIDLYKYFEVDKLEELLTGSYSLFSGEWDEIVVARQQWVMDFAHKLGDLIDSAAPGALGAPQVGELRQQLDKLLNCGLTYTDLGKIVFYSLDNYLDAIRVRAGEINKCINTEIKKQAYQNGTVDSQILGYLKNLTVSTIVDSVASLQRDLKGYGDAQFAKDFRAVLERVDVMLGNLSNFSWNTIRNTIYSFVNVDIDENGNYNEDQLTGAVRNLRDVMRGYADEYSSRRTINATDYYGNSYDGYFAVSADFYEFISSARNKLLPILYILLPNNDLQGGDIVQPDTSLSPGGDIYLVAQLLLNPSTYTMLQNVANKLYDGLINVFEIMSNEDFLRDLVRVMAKSVQSSKDRTVSIANRGAIDDFYDNYLQDPEQYGEGNMSVRIKEYTDSENFYPEDVTTIDQKLEYIYDFYYYGLYYGRIINLATLLEVAGLYDNKVLNDINDILGLTKRGRQIPAGVLDYADTETLMQYQTTMLILSYDPNFALDGGDTGVSAETVQAIYQYFVEYYTNDFNATQREAFGYVSPEEFLQMPDNSEKQLQSNIDNLVEWIMLNNQAICNWVVNEYEINKLAEAGYKVNSLNELQGIDIYTDEGRQVVYDMLVQNREVKPQVDRTLDYSKQKLVALTNSYIATIYGTRAADKFVNEGSGLVTFENVYNDMLMLMRKGYIIQRLYPIFDFMNSFYNGSGDELSVIHTATQVVIPREIRGDVLVEDNNAFAGVLSKLVSAFIGSKGSKIYVGNGHYHDVNYDGLSGYTMQALMEEVNRTFTAMALIPEDLITVIGYSVNAVKQGDEYYFTLGNMTNPIYLAKQNPETKIYEPIHITSEQFDRTLSSICGESGQLTGLIAYPQATQIVNGVIYITEVEIKSNYSVSTLLDSIDINENKEELLSIYSGYTQKVFDAIQNSLASVCLDGDEAINAQIANVNKLNEFLDIYANELNRLGYNLNDTSSEPYKALNILYDLYVFVNDFVYKDNTELIQHNLSETNNIDKLLTDLGTIMLEYNHTILHGSNGSDFLLKRYYVIGTNFVERLEYVYNYVQKFVEFTKDPERNKDLYALIDYATTISGYEEGKGYKDPVSIDELIAMCKQNLLDYARDNAEEPNAAYLTEANLKKAVEVWTPIIRKIITMNMYTGLYRTRSYYKQGDSRQFSNSVEQLADYLGGKSTAGTWIPFGLDFDLMTGQAVSTTVTFGVMENDNVGFDFYKQLQQIYLDSDAELFPGNSETTYYGIQTIIKGLVYALEDFNSIELFKEVNGVLVSIDDDRYYTDVFTLDDLVTYWNDYVTDYNAKYGVEAQTVEFTPEMEDEDTKYMAFCEAIQSSLQALGLYEIISVSGITLGDGSSTEPQDYKYYVLSVINIISHYEFMSIDMKAVLNERIQKLQVIANGKMIMEGVIEVPGEIMTEALYNVLLLLPVQGIGVSEVLLDMLNQYLDAWFESMGINRR